MILKEGNKLRSFSSNTAAFYMRILDIFVSAKNCSQNPLLYCVSHLHKLIKFYNTVCQFLKKRLIIKTITYFITFNKFTITIKNK